MSKTFTSKVTRWLQRGRYIRVGVSGKFRPLVYVALGDAGGERYALYSTDEARRMGIALIETAARVDEMKKQAARQATEQAA